MSVPAEVVQWVECSRCAKWRIIPPMPDRSHMNIPDIWFCEMNTDLRYNTCEAPEQEYKAPEPIMEVPLLVPQGKRLPKLNDPDSIRNRLKSLSNEELASAYESMDIRKLLEDELGGSSKAEIAKSVNLVIDLPPPVEPSRSSKKYNAKSSAKKIYDMDLMRKELHALVKEADQLLPTNITSQIRR
jgi:hypothetical protein